MIADVTGPFVYARLQRSAEDGPKATHPKRSTSGPTGSAPSPPAGSPPICQGQPRAAARRDRPPVLRLRHQRRQGARAGRGDGADRAGGEAEMMAFRVPHALQRAISAFTRVFDALWLQCRCGTPASFFDAAKQTGTPRLQRTASRCAARGEQPRWRTAREIRAAPGPVAGASGRRYVGRALAAPAASPGPFPSQSGRLPEACMARLVMKFGGTSVADLERIRSVARLVQREVDAGHQVAVVVSAMAGKTNELVAWCRRGRAAARARRIRRGGRLRRAGDCRPARHDPAAMGVPRAPGWAGRSRSSPYDAHGRARIDDIPPAS